MSNLPTKEDAQERRIQKLETNLKTLIAWLAPVLGMAACKQLLDDLEDN